MYIYSIYKNRITRYRSLWGTHAHNSAMRMIARLKMRDVLIYVPSHVMRIRVCVKT